MAGALVLHQGRIFTGRRFVSRLVAENGRIVAADEGGASGPEVPTGAERVDLHGRLVVPGFVDAHLHPTETALRWAGVDLRDARSFSEVAERIRVRAALVPGPVWGGGFEEARLAEGTVPTRTDLDRWLPDRPLLLTRNCEHVAVVNSAALSVLRVDRSTPEFQGDSVDRDRSGEPTGVFRERALRHLQAFPFPGLGEQPELGSRFFARAAQLGLVAIGGLRASPEEVDWAEAWTSRTDAPPTPRYVAFGAVGGPGDIEAWGRRRKRGAHSVVGIKLFADGSFGARSAWLETPYADTPGRSGGPSLAPAEWEGAVRSADAAGLRVAAHALGDRALRQVVETLEAVRPEAQARIEHAGLIPGALFTRLSRLAPQIVVQPGFRTSDAWLGQALGPERVRAAYPLASLCRRGLVVAGSSDAPVETLDPRDGIRSAIAPEAIGESLTSQEALAIYTSGAAAALGLGDLGHLEVGASASCVVWSAGAGLRGVELPVGGSREVWIAGQRVPDEETGGGGPRDDIRPRPDGRA
jgi:predicted amidohydrolase YtcJ